MDTACYFAIPFASYSAISASSLPLSSKKLKRKRAASNTSCTSSSSSCTSLEVDSNNSQNPLDVLTNPLSLSQEEIVQYKLAGLELNEELPSVPEWPHRSVPVLSNLSIRGKKSEEEKDDGKRKRFINRDHILGERPSFHEQDVLEERNGKVTKGHQLRLQHINVLTTILHKCLLARDIQRASRAWGLLIRMQVSGQGMDLRASGYWGIGAELLIRSLSKKKLDANVISDIEETGETPFENRDNNSSLETSIRRWDIKEGLQRAKDYYERLIVEYPFRKQFSSKVCALDWWPVMISCEIYGIQYEQKKGLQNLEKKTKYDGDSSDSISSGESGWEENMSEEDTTIASDENLKHERLAMKKRFRKLERCWQIENDIRLVALNASTQIATRLDERMTIPPYSESLDMLRLRGMLSLYIGDLLVPPLAPEPKFEKSEINYDTISRGIDQNLERRIFQRRILVRERKIEFEKGLERRSQEIRTANNFFDKLVRLGGHVDLIDKRGEDLGIDGEDEESLLESSSGSEDNIYE